MKNHSGLFSSLHLKIIACVLMTLDHIAMLFINPGQSSTPETTYYVLRAIGKMSFPIFTFLSFVGINKTSNAKLYIIRQLILSVTLDLIGYIFGIINKIEIRNNIIIGNSFTDILLGTSMIYFLNMKNKYSLFAIIPFILAILSIIDTNTSYGTIIKTNWSLYSITLYLFLYLANILAKRFSTNKAISNNIDVDEYLCANKERYFKYISCVFIVTNGFIYYLIFLLSGSAYLLPGKSNYIPVGTYNVLAVIFIFFYNFKLGYTNKNIKYIFYIYYPLHLFILAIISFSFGYINF